MTEHIFRISAVLLLTVHFEKEKGKSASREV